MPSLRQFMHRIDIGEQEIDRDRLDLAFRLDAPGQGPHLVFVQRHVRFGCLTGVFANNGIN